MSSRLKRHWNISLFFKWYNYEDCKVDNCKTCNLGRWISICEDKNTHFTGNIKWEELKQNHQDVHDRIQEYVTKNANRIENQHLRQIANEIENSTVKVFDSLNDILFLESDSNKK